APQAFTVQPPQTWSKDLVTDVGTTAEGTAESSKDIRFAYAVHDATGAPDNGALGTFAAFVLDNDQQMILRNISQETEGLPLPADLAFDFQKRASPDQGRPFMQADGRPSTPLDAALALFDSSVRPAGVSPLPYVNDHPDIDAHGLERVTLQLKNLSAATAAT